MKKFNGQIQYSLIKTTRKLLKTESLFPLAEDTGIPYAWLKKFSDGEFNNPSVNRVQYLYEHLSNNSLCK